MSAKLVAGSTFFLAAAILLHGAMLAPREGGVLGLLALLFGLPGLGLLLWEIASERKRIDPPIGPP